ncbi:hypothetical protein ACRAWD_20495 [Caulobacter segnis]
MTVGTVTALNYLLEPDALVDLLKQVEGATALLPRRAGRRGSAFPQKLARVRQALPAFAPCRLRRRAGGPEGRSISRRGSQTPAMSGPKACRPILTAASCCC